MRRTTIIDDGDDIELTLEPTTPDQPIRIFDANGELAVEFVGTTPRVLSTQVCLDPAAHVAQPARRWALAVMLVEMGVGLFVIGFFIGMRMAS